MTKSSSVFKYVVQFYWVLCKESVFFFLKPKKSSKNMLKFSGSEFTLFLCPYNQVAHHFGVANNQIPFNTREPLKHPNVPVSVKIYFLDEFEK